LPEADKVPDISESQQGSVKPLSSQLKSQLAQQSNQTQQPQQPEQKQPDQPQQPIQPIQTQSGVYISQIGPKVGDKDGELINNAFNTLLNKINTVKGEDFSIELQAIADLVLEKRGFSVTLHKLRSCINKFKESKFNFTDLEKQEIFNEMEEWKQHLL